MQIFLYVLLGIFSLILFILFTYLTIGYSGYKFAMSRKSLLKKKIEKKSLTKRSNECKSYFESYEKINIRSFDNLNLCAFYKNNNSKKLALVVHGYGGTHFDVYMQCLMFENKGFDILAVDLRAHGESEGDMLTMGFFEHKDLHDWLNKMAEIKSYEILLYGISMGASSICMTLDEKNMQNNIKCAIEDCGFDNANREFSYVFSRNKLKCKWIYNIFYSYVKKVKKIELKKIDVIEKLKKTNIPLLLIHGGKDNFVPTEMVYNLYEVVKDKNAKLYIVENAGHGDAFESNPSLYRQEVYNFINRYF